MSEIIKVKVSDLQVHPKNVEIYGRDEDISDLKEKIQRSGQVHTLVVTSHNVVLAGHRRLRVCKDLGIEEVDAEIRDFDTPEQEVEFLVDNNATREKTNEQKAREALALKEIETLLSKQRQGKRNDLTSAQNGAEVRQNKKPLRTTDVIAQKVNFKSGREAERAMKTVEIIDELQQEGRNKDADLICGVLNNGSVSSAECLAKNIDSIGELLEEDRAAIKSGKKSPNSFIKKPSVEKNEETDQCDIEQYADNQNEGNILYQIQKRYSDYLSIFEKDISNLVTKNFYQDDDDITNRVRSELGSCLEKFKGIRVWIENMEEDDLGEDNAIIIKRQ